MARSYRGERKKAWLAVLAGTTLVFGLSGAALADISSIEMKGDYVWTAVSSAGTLGVGESTQPGLIHDPTGAGAFDLDTDYITPGSPFEGFSVSVAGSYLENNNDGYSSPEITPVSLENLSGTAGYDQHLRWTGQVEGKYQVVHEFYFNDGDERINIKTTLKALAPLSDVLFHRIVDPDPDVLSGGDYDTVNQRGYGGAAPEDWVFSSGTLTGRTLSLFTASEIAHNTSISADWDEDPAVTLTGVDDGDGDYTIALGFDVGDMTEDQVVELLYAYVMGGSIDDIVSGGTMTKPPIENMINASLRNLAGIVAARAHLPLNATTDKSGEWRVWAQQVVANVDHDKASKFDGYDTDIAQSVVGLEKNFGNLAAGMAFSLGQVEMDMDHNRVESDADMFTATLYGNYTENALFASAGLTYAHSEIEEEYPSRSADASFDADAYSGHILGGYKFPLADWLNVIPTAGVRATYYDQDSYTESGSSERKVESYDQWFIESTLGATLAAKFAMTNDVKYEPVMFEPELSVAWLHEFNDDDEKLGFSTGTSKNHYLLQGAEADQLQVSLALNATIGNNLKFGVSATGEGNNDVENMVFMGNVTYQF